MLGMIAVGFIIFCAIIGSYFLVFTIWDESHDISKSDLILIVILIMLFISIYCAISGTYLLRLGGFV
jgi:hypothetical protein